jgi:hypothetical protein
VRTSVDYDKMNGDEKKKFDVAVNEQNINTVNQYVNSLTGMTEVSGIIVANPNISLKDLSEKMKTISEKKKIDKTPTNTDSEEIEELLQMNAGHDDFYILSRLLTSGYVPMLNGSTREEVFGSSGKIMSFFKGVAWIIPNGAMLTTKP